MDIQSYQTTLDILHGGFIVCTVLAVLFLVTAILLFWRFGMLTIIQQRFGIEAKRSREEFKEVNESTGALKYHSAALGERTPRSQLRPEDAPASLTIPAVAQVSGGLPFSGGLATGAQAVESPTPLTTQLNAESAAAPAAETLAATQGTTTQESVQIAGFEVTKNVLLIHASRDALVP